MRNVPKIRTSISICLPCMVHAQILVKTHQEQVNTWTYAYDIEKCKNAPAYKVIIILTLIFIYQTCSTLSHAQCHLALNPLLFLVIGQVSYQIFRTELQDVWQKYGLGTTLCKLHSKLRSQLSHLSNYWDGNWSL